MMDKEKTLLYYLPEIDFKNLSYHELSGIRKAYILYLNFLDFGFHDTRIKRLLWDLKIKELNDVNKISDKEFLDLRMCGPKILIAIKNCLKGKSNVQEPSDI